MFVFVIESLIRLPLLFFTTNIGRWRAQKTGIVITSIGVWAKNGLVVGWAKIKQIYMEKQNVMASSRR